MESLWERPRSLYLSLPIYITSKVAEMCVASIPNRSIFVFFFSFGSLAISYYEVDFEKSIGCCSNV